MCLSHCGPVYDSVDFATPTLTPLDPLLFEIMYKIAGIDEFFIFLFFANSCVLNKNADLHSPCIENVCSALYIHILIDLIHILRGKSNKSHVQKKKTPIISTLVQELPASPPLSAAAVWGRHSE